MAWALAILSATMSVARAKEPRTLRLVCDRLLGEVLLFPVGLLGLWAALGHLAFASQSAAAIGWAPSPFQTEVGFANLGLGLGGVLGYVYRNWGYRLGIAVVTAGFLWGAASLHIIEIVRTGNLAAGNAGPILYTDILTPLALLVLLALTRRSTRDIDTAD
ncbi:DUF6790 family protein [Xanthobacteraceae bacterium A53D]